jgi:hypothetical protein
MGWLAKKEIRCCRTLATMLISVRCAALDARFACAWLAITVYVIRAMIDL